jgi:hypothetical protein
LQVNGQSYTHEEACWELERLMAQVKALVATNEAYSAAERSENDVWQIALKDMSAQLQVTSSERAACQTAMLRLQECVATVSAFVEVIGSMLCTIYVISQQCWN